MVYRDVMDLDPASLRMMRAIADAGTISGAATSLSTSQPAVSQQVRRLEAKLGTSLLERQGRGVRLTEAGMVLAKHGVAICAALNAAGEELESLSGLQTGRLRLAAFPSASSTLVPGALAALRRDHPGVSITFTELEPPAALDALSKGHVDVVLSFDFSDVLSEPLATDVENNMSATSLVDEPQWMVVPKSHPLANQTESVALEQFSSDSWIAGCEKCRIHLLRVCDRSGFTPEVAFATDDNAAALALVGAGLGVSLVSGLVLEQSLTDHVEVLRLDSRLTRHISFVTTPDLQGVPAVKAAQSVFIEQARKYHTASKYGVATASLSSQDVRVPARSPRATAPSTGAGANPEYSHHTFSLPPSNRG